MVDYSCLRCGYIASQKINLKHHLNRKNICNPILDDISIEEVKKYYGFETSSKITPKSSKNPPKSSKTCSLKILQNPSKILQNVKKSPPKSSKMQKPLILVQLCCQK